MAFNIELMIQIKSSPSKGDDTMSKSRNPEEVIDKIDNIDMQIDNCLDGLSEKG